MQNSNFPRNRETALAFGLLAVLVGAFFLLLNFFFGGIFNVLAVVMVGVTTFGYLHYVLWGHRLSQQTAGERAEELRRAELEAEAYEREQF
jgi:hypothetical protein